MNDEPLTDEQKLDIAADAQQRIHDAVADYVRVTKQEGDAEILSDTIVLFEALGILEIAGDRLRDNLMHTGCEECE